MEITIHGLTHNQKILADVIWHMDNMNSVNGFIRSLNTEQLRHDARVALNMIVAESLDQHMDINQETVDFLAKL